MNCPNCGANNIEGSTFCIKCGTNLKVSQQPVNVTPVQPEQIIEPQQNINVAQPAYVQPQQTYQTQGNQSATTNTAPLSYVMYLVAILLKPIQTFKEEESKLSNAKTSIILSVIVSAIMMIINLLKSMISVVAVKSLDYSTFKYKTTFQFGNLKSLDYLSLIGKNFLIYAAIIFAIAVVYYLGTLVIKKSASFVKMLAISATSVVPYIVLGMVVSPLIGKIWAPLSIVASVVGIVYSLLIFFSLINKDLEFTKSDYRVYFNLVCLSILAVAGYYVYIKIFTSGIASQLNNLINLFN